MDKKKRYDTTGETTDQESHLPPGETTWADYFNQLWTGAVNKTTIEEFAKTYIDSQEEKDDVVKGEGWIDNVALFVLFVFNPQLMWIPKEIY